MKWISVIEWIGVFFGVISVIAAARGSVLTWSTGIVSCVAYVFFHWYQKLYFSMGLQIFYIITCVYGWYEWNKVNPNEKDGIRRIPTWRYLVYIPSIIALTLIFGYYLDIKTDDPLPYLDTFATVLSIAGQWFLIRKYIENWIVWIVADSVYCYVFWAQKNTPSLLLFSLYLIFAVVGFLQWKKKRQIHLSA